jgi:hypothetical protein
MSNELTLQDLEALIGQAPAEDLEKLIAVRGIISKRIGELENPEGVEVTMQAEGTVEVPTE